MFKMHNLSMAYPADDIETRVLNNISIKILVGLFALAIAWLTVASNTTRVARGNLINALRYK